MQVIDASAGGHNIRPNARLRNKYIDLSQLLGLAWCGRLCLALDGPPFCFFVANYLHSVRCGCGRRCGFPQLAFVDETLLQRGPEKLFLRDWPPGIGHVDDESHL